MSGTRKAEGGNTQAEAPQQPETTPVAATHRVTFAYPVVIGETKYSPDDTAELAYSDALELVLAGRARWAEDKEK